MEIKKVPDTVSLSLKNIFVLDNKDVVMNKIFAIFGFIVLVATVGYCQETFRVEDANCSFEIPDSWELVSEEIGDMGKGMMIEHFFIDRSVAIISTSILYGHKYNIKFTNEISLTRVEKRTEARLISTTTEPGKQAVLDKSVEYLLKKMKKCKGDWDRAKLDSADCYYDADRHAYYKSIVLYKPSKPEAGSLIEFHARFLGASREAIFGILWQGDDPDAFLDYAYSIVDSFSYDDGYGFGEGAINITETLVKPAISNDKSFYVICMVVFMGGGFLIKKWVNS